ncbi:MAG: hypothetical protein WCA32_14640 [Chromatiaceae bacterium]
MSGASHGQRQYYVLDPRHWPLVAMLSVLLILAGVALTINHFGFGPWMIVGGLALLMVMFHG